MDIAVDSEGDADLDTARGLRLVTAMAASGCKRSELAHLCQVSERTVTRYRSGAPIPPRLRPAVCARCEISEYYLIHGDKPGLPLSTPVSIVSAMTDTPEQTDAADDVQAVNRVPLHRLHIALLRHLRQLPEHEHTAALDRIINNRWAGPAEPFKGGKPVLDGVPLDRYEIAAVLALRAIQDVGREVSLINHLLSTRPGGR